MSEFLETDKIKLEFDKNTGAIIGLLNKITGWQVIRQPRLAMGIQLLVPIKEHRNNKVRSELQNLTEFQKLNEKQAILKWNGVRGDKSGDLDISIESKISLEDSEIHFEIAVDNRSPYTIEELWYPCLGGLRESDSEPALESLSLHGCGGLSRKPR